MTREVREAIETYRFSDAAHSLYGFIWHELCDWYLELVKPNFYGKVTAFDLAPTASCLLATLTDALKLLHPFMPFMTEEIYQRLPAKDADSIMIAPFPEVDNRPDRRRG